VFSCSVAFTVVSAYKSIDRRQTPSRVGPLKPTMLETYTNCNCITDKVYGRQTPSRVGLLNQLCWTHIQFIMAYAYRGNDVNTPFAGGLTPGRKMLLTPRDFESFVYDESPLTPSNTSPNTRADSKRKVIVTQHCSISKRET